MALAVLAAALVTVTVILTAPSRPRRSESLGGIAAALGFNEQTWDDDFAAHASLDGDWNRYIASKSSAGTPWNGELNGGDTYSQIGGDDDAEYFLASQVGVVRGEGLVIHETRAPRGGLTFASGCVSTYGHVEFRSGLLEIRAKMPNMSAGLWPGLWLLPGPNGTGSENELDIYEGGATAGPNSLDTMTYHGTNGVQTEAYRSPTSLAGSFHTYGVDYEPGKSITWYLDGKAVFKVTKNVGTDPYELIIDLQVANENARGWRAVSSSATPAAQMVISDIAIYSRR